MIPKIIHQTSRKLTSEEVRLGRRLRAMLPAWEYRFWNDADNERLVAEQFPQHVSSFAAIRRGVIKADIARYMYLSACGGFYFDTDYKLLRPIDQETLSHPCVLPISRESEGEPGFRLGNAVMGSEAGHPFWTDFTTHIFSHAGLIDLAEPKIEKVTGPEGLTDFYLSRRGLYRDIYLPGKALFHPHHTLGGFSSRIGEETIGVHLCWGSWRTANPLGMMRRIIHRKLTSG